MSSKRNGLRSARRIIGALALSLALVCGPNLASAAKKRSSPEDLQRFVAVTRSLEQTPLDEKLQRDRQWALAWLTEAPDVTVTICVETLKGMYDEDYPHTAEIMVQDSFAMGAFAIEHPDEADDPEAQHLAGVESALNAYRAILREKPEAKSAFLDKLLQTQASGGLADHVRQAECGKGKSVKVR